MTNALMTDDPKVKALLAASIAFRADIMSLQGNCFDTEKLSALDAALAALAPPKPHYTMPEWKEFVKGKAAGGHDSDGIQAVWVAGHVITRDQYNGTREALAVEGEPSARPVPVVVWHDTGPGKNWWRVAETPRTTIYFADGSRWDSVVGWGEMTLEERQESGLEK